MEIHLTKAKPRIRTRKQPLRKFWGLLCLLEVKLYKLLRQRAVRIIDHIHSPDYTTERVRGQGSLWLSPKKLWTLLRLGRKVICRGGLVNVKARTHERRGRRPEEAENGFMFKFFSSCHEIRILFHQSLDTYFPPSTPRPGICGKGCGLAFLAPGTTAWPFRHISSISSRNRPKAKASPYKTKTSFACLMFCFGNKNANTQRKDSYTTGRC